MTKCSCNCECDNAPRLIFSCSGASDTGELSDRVARKMTHEGSGSMACLAGIGGRISGIQLSAEAAGAILVIDGCPQDCAKKTLELAGLKNIRHVQLSELGYLKGRTEINDENIARIADKAKNLMEDPCL